MYSEEDPGHIRVDLWTLTTALTSPHSGPASLYNLISHLSPTDLHRIH